MYRTRDRRSANVSGRTGYADEQSVFVERNGEWKMRRLVQLLSTAVIATAAADATDIEIFFNTSDQITSWSRSAPQIEVACATPTRLYIWANIDLYDYTLFNGMGLSFVTVGDVTVADGELYNPNMGEDSGKGSWTGYKRFRWQNGAIGGSEPFDPIPMSAEGDLDASAVVGAWLNKLGRTPANGDFALDTGDTLAYSAFDPNAPSWVGSYLLGHINVQVLGQGEVYFTVSPAKITAEGGNESDQVYFGLNPPVPQRTPGAGGPGVDRVADARFVSTILRADVNCDAVITNADIDPFLLALTEPQTYAIRYPDCPIESADCNEDGLVNYGDIDSFVAILVGP